MIGAIAICAKCRQDRPVYATSPLCREEEVCFGCYGVICEGMEQEQSETTKEGA